MWLILFVLLFSFQLQALPDNPSVLQSCVSISEVDSSIPMLGEIRLYAGKWLPYSGTWAFCDGRTLDKNTYVSLYKIMGNRYGGDGNPNFNIPKLASLVPGMRYLICIANGIYPEPAIDDPRVPITNPITNTPPPSLPIIERVTLGEIRLYAGAF